MFRILVEADYALFTRPEMKVERVSYSVPTPSALDGMLKSVYWKPAIRYVIDKIVVFNPVVYVSIRRNEVKNKVLLSAVKGQMSGKDADPVIYTSDCISQRASLMLKNVKYGVEFHFELTNIHNEKESNGNAKHAEIIKRRLEKGQCFRQPCMGCRELAVKNITLVDDFDYGMVDSSLLNTQDLGYMLYCLNFNDNEKLKDTWSAEYFSDSAEAVYYHPFMINGVIDVQKYRRGDYDIVKPV
jgi:CRISPR-associated protein Cas5d